MRAFVRLFLSIALSACATLILINGAAADTPDIEQTAPVAEGSAVETGIQAPSNAQHADLFPYALAQSVVRQTDALDLLRKAVERLRNDDTGLENQRLELTQLAQEMAATKTALAPLLAAVDREIEQLGPAVEAKDTTEAPELTRERNHLQAIRVRVTAAQKRTDLSLLRAQKLEEKIQEYYLQNFTKNILKRSDSPISGRLWRNLDAALPRLWIQITTIADNWWAAAKLQFGALVLMLAVSAACYACLFIARHHIFQAVPANSAQPQSGFLRQALRTSWFVPITAMPGAVAATVLFVVGDLFHIWDGSIRTFMQSALWAFLVFALLTALATGILQPQRPRWGWVDIPTETAQRLLWSVNAIISVYTLDLFLHEAIRLFYMPVEIRIIETSLANGAFAALLMAFALTALPEVQEHVRAWGAKLALNVLRIPLLLAAVMIVIVTLAGYVALGRFIVGQIILMGAGGVAVLLAHLAIRVIAEKPENFSAPTARLTKYTSMLTPQRWQQIIDVIAFAANVLLIGVAFALLLLSWGVPLSQLTDALQSFLFGFEIGQVRISLFKILIGIGLFVAVMFVTRLLQRWMQRSVLSAPTIDRGIANSLHTGLGYLGIGVAALIGISYAGIDLTQLTLVIGALSLGIGLGLQSIVNNFVSGLILLVERPVKVGDWVVIGDEQGYVRKISVRATEIETFDRASVIIPNSALISGNVQNWTHRSPMGRIVIPIGVSYQSDPQEVHDLLIAVAKASDKVLGFPEPFVAFEDFGASSLDFSLRCYIGDINSSLSAKTALRMEIFKRFKKHGIEIPYPQQDLHLRNLDDVKSEFARVQKGLSETSPAPSSS